MGSRAICPICDGLEDDCDCMSNDTVHSDAREAAQHALSEQQWPRWVREIVFPLRAERDELKEALEAMCGQYIMDDGHGAGHMFMSAGEYATRVMSTLYPDEWQDTGCGLRYVGGGEA